MSNDKCEVRETLWSLEQNRKKLLQPFFADLGLTLGQGQPRILDNLLKKDKVTQKELAEACRMDVTTLSRTLDRLEETGLLIRQKHPECRRSYLIALTEEGKEKARQVRDVFRKADSKIWQGFEDAEMNRLLEGLKKISKNLDEGF